MLAFGIVALCLLGILAAFVLFFFGLMIVEKEDLGGIIALFVILAALATSIVYVSLTLGGT